MIRVFRTVFAAAILLSTTLVSHAQFGSVKPTGVNAAFLKLFGSHTNFTATIDAKVLDKEGKDWVRVPVNMASLNGTMAMKINLTQAVIRDLPDFMRDSLKQYGLSEVISIVKPDTKSTLMIYPGAQSYVNLPLSAEEALDYDQGYKVSIQSLGKEKIENKERTKNRVSVLNKGGTTLLEATTWNAPELKNFPAKIETKQDGMTFLLTFSDIKLGKPDAAQFEVPKTFTQYKDMQQMMFSIMKRIAFGSGDSK